MQNNICTHCRFYFKAKKLFQDLLEICGGDRTPGLVWSNLRTVYLRFNLLQKLDQSLVRVITLDMTLRLIMEKSFQVMRLIITQLSCCGVVNWLMTMSVSDSRLNSFLLFIHLVIMLLFVIFMVLMLSLQS